MSDTRETRRISGCLGARGSSLNQVVPGHRRLTLFLCRLLAGCLFVTSSPAVESPDDPIAVPDGTDTYIFVPERSTVTQYGGFTGRPIRWPIEGQFSLSIDLRDHTASFSQVDANIVDGTSKPPVSNLDRLFNLTGLRGYVVGDAKVAFIGKGSINTTWGIRLTLAFTREGVRLSGFLDGFTGPDSASYGLDALAQYNCGTGEPNNPHRIYTCEQMNAVGADPNLWDEHFRLMANIDLSRCRRDGFHIIGRPDNPFRGIFDGNGHSISNFIYAQRSEDHVGFFGHVAGPQAEIRDLTLIDPNLADSRYTYGSHVGSLIGYLEEGTLAGCRATGAYVTGRLETGGLVGRNDGLIRDCCVTGAVFGPSELAGGLAGGNSGVVRRCYSITIVSGGCAGGLVGSNASRVTQTGTTRRVLADLPPLVEDCYSMGYVSGWPAGGLVGGNDGALSHCYSTCYVVGGQRTGGLTATAGSASVVDACFWDVQASGQETSAAGNGKTTAEMKARATFLAAGWDLTGESVNGAEDIWSILDGQEYPKLQWELTRQP